MLCHLLRCDLLDPSLRYLHVAGTSWVCACRGLADLKPRELAAETCNMLIK